ncbi:hypothetical protein [Calothrix sp. NIES-2098]|uniref:hypothetical protein n=1 Tax=Calothrix sp. NIES-2098 TaxID=1954171 RepID=UPI000B6100C6|nr:hypothetical protein NIES2098_73620 [Calothrix sp. NIES-2098]
MKPQQQPFIHTDVPIITTVPVDPATLPQCWVNAPGLILATAALIRAVTTLIQVLREPRKQK